MNEARGRRLLELLRAALDVAPDEREAWVAERCVDERDLADELRDLLATDTDRWERERALASVAARIASDDHLADLSGTWLGEFRLAKRLGQGGAAVVYVADHERLGRRVALKIMRRAWTLRSGEANFRHEARALARLRHENVAVVYDYGLHELRDPLGGLHTVPWLAVELVEDARPIADVAAGRPLAEKLALLVQACRGLAAAHEALIEHGDVSSANVLVGADGRVKVVDFGLARLEASGETRGSSAICGNLPYLAPELLEARADLPIASAARDVYSFGIVMLEVLGEVGAARLRGEILSPAELARRPPPRLARVAPSLPRELDWIVAKATATAPVDRYRNAGEVLDELERFVARRPLSIAEHRWTYVSRKYLARHPWRIGTLVAALATLLVAGSWWSDHHRAVQRASEQNADLDLLEGLVDGLLGVFDPTGDSSDPVRLDPEARPILRRIRDQLVAQEFGDVDRRVALLARIGNTFRKRGDFEDAEPALARAFELVAGSGERSLACGERRHDLAILAHAAERFAEAEAHSRAALALHEDILGPAAERTRHMRDDLAELLMVHPDGWPETEQLLRLNLDLAPPGDDAARRLAWQRLGHFYLACNRTLDAARTIDAGTCDELSPEVPAARRANALFMRGRLFHALQDHHAALRDLEDCANLRRALGPRFRLQTAEALLARTFVLSSVGRGAERLEGLRELLAIYAQAIDEQHPLMLMARGIFAPAAAAEGLTGEALATLDVVLDSIDRKYGPTSVRSMRERVDAASWLLDAGEGWHAECRLAEALEIHAASRRPRDQHLARALLALAASRARRGDLRGALQWSSAARGVTAALRPQGENLRLDAWLELCRYACESGRRALALAGARALGQELWSDPARQDTAAEHADRWTACALDGG